MSRGDNLRTYHERRRQEGAANAAAFRARCEAAAAGIEQRTGLKLFVNPSLGGFTLRIEDAETFLASV